MENRKLVIGSGMAAGLCFVLARVYDLFGHGVRSAYMDRAWMLPAGAMAWYLLNSLFGHPVRERGHDLCFAGVSTLTAASVMKGIFEIAGTDSTWLTGFWIIGLVFLAAVPLEQIAGNRSCHHT